LRASLEDAVQRGLAAGQLHVAERGDAGIVDRRREFAGAGRRRERPAVDRQEAAVSGVDDGARRAAYLDIPYRQRVLIVAQPDGPLIDEPYMVEGQAIFGLRRGNAGGEALDGEISG
jgi:hypothetical protein